MKTAEKILHKIKLEENSHALTASNYALTDDAIVKAMHEFANQWISVEDELPKVDNENNPFGERVECLVVWLGYVYKGQYMNIGEPHWSVSHVSSSSSLDVTHWMPLPQPPKSK